MNFLLDSATMILSLLQRIPRPPISTPFPYTTLFRSVAQRRLTFGRRALGCSGTIRCVGERGDEASSVDSRGRSEEHTSELQSRGHLVCRLLLEKKKNGANNEIG